MATHTGIVNPRPRKPAACGFAVVGLLLAAGSPLLAGPMHEEKLWTVPSPEQTIHPRLPVLMRNALTEDMDLSKIKALGEIARHKLTDLTADAAAMLADPSVIVQTSALVTLDALDDPAAAAGVMPLIRPRERYDSAIAEQTMLADRLIARWYARQLEAGPSGRTEPFKGAADTWAARAHDDAVPASLRRSALSAMARTVVAKSVASLVRDASLPLGVRLAAAEAHARHTGSADDPVGLAAELSQREPLLAVRLLGAAEGAAAVEALNRLAASPSTAVQAAALRRLVEIDPALIQPLAPAAIRSGDPSVRLVVAAAMTHWRVPSAVALLLSALDDEHPDVRLAAHASLRALAAEKPLYDAVASGLMTILDDAAAESQAKTMARWRQAERAAILLGEIDHKPAHAKLVRLFAHPRTEVPTAAVVGLRPLAVESTYPIVAKLVADVLSRMDGRSAKAREESKSMFRGEQVDANQSDSALVAEAAQTLGVWRFAPADPTLRRLIPKESVAYAPARAAGIWALGMIHQDKPDPALAKTLTERIYDLNPNNPEANDVRLASVVAIGRMKAVTELKGVRLRLDQDSLDIRCAARWAIIRMTGEAVPEITLEPLERSDAFITPMP